MARVRKPIMATEEVRVEDLQFGAVVLVEDEGPFVFSHLVDGERTLTELGSARTIAPHPEAPVQLLVGWELETPKEEHFNEVIKIRWTRAEGGWHVVQVQYKDEGWKTLGRQTAHILRDMVEFPAVAMGTFSTPSGQYRVNLQKVHMLGLELDTVTALALLNRVNELYGDWR